MSDLHVVGLQDPPKNTSGGGDASLPVQHNTSNIGLTFKCHKIIYKYLLAFATTMCYHVIVSNNKYEKL